MKICPRCGANLDDAAQVCPNCGLQFQPAAYQPAPTATDDHTAEFDPKDISDNKCLAMLPYIMGVVGIVICLLDNSGSKYVQFHLRQALKLLILNTIAGIAALILCFTIIVPIACSIFITVLFVVNIICFVHVCQGKAVEAPVVKSFGFLK